ncbi:hypothetical protein MTR67_025594 [Solanum verrucosum]|uniref:Uncharacterized protein n=1 Tax=Solanum verrucosum TaxID=315347 RepID=A0AAF0R634_SOLVR|nr:hypothetical protein MTR67_025594 [Solanum verrucosum]
MDHLSQILGGAIGTLPSIYLGMPLGDEYRSIDIWNPILEKCEKKLTRWRSQYLSLGGRLTLINSVLDALPTYMLSIFHIPQSVVQRLDKIRRNFLWQGNKERKGFHLVKWKNIIRSKEQGGPGIKNLKYQSKALKVKWLWRYHQEDQVLWYRVIKSKYEQLNTWVTKEVNTPYGISLWKSISIFWQFLSNQLTVKVRNGRKTSFWIDKWMGTVSLKDLFIDIFVLAQHQEKTVAEMWSPQGWNMIFRRNLNDWEIPRMIELFTLLESFQGIQTGEDYLWWHGHNK